MHPTLLHLDYSSRRWLVCYIPRHWSMSNIACYNFESLKYLTINAQQVFITKSSPTEREVFWHLLVLFFFFLIISTVFIDNISTKLVEPRLYNIIFKSQLITELIRNSLVKLKSFLCLNNRSELSLWAEAITFPFGGSLSLSSYGSLASENINWKHFSFTSVHLSLFQEPFVGFL